MNDWVGMLLFLGAWFALQTWVAALRGAHLNGPPAAPVGAPGWERRPRTTERMCLMSEFGMKRNLQLSFEQALEQVPAALKTEGFGVLTEIDVRATLKQKLDVEFRPYRILGACNPPFAHKALQADLEAGLMMPCNVIVYQDDGGKAVVMAIDPTRTVAASGNPALMELAMSVKTKLGRALERLA
jgi:uncharacterized protein (DUF302 family)